MRIKLCFLAAVLGRSPGDAIFRESILAVVLPCGTVGPLEGVRKEGGSCGVVTVWEQTYYYCLFKFKSARVQNS